MTTSFVSWRKVAISEFRTWRGLFPLLPLAPEVWPFFTFHWWDLDDRDDSASAVWKLYMHTCADFGAAGAPGTWNRFFVE
eukprot:5570872-Pleurochrysis_carterae.AAC.1